MNRNELLRRFPNASESFIKANSDPEPSSPRKDAVMECHPGTEPLAKGQGEKANPGRVHIRFVSVRKCLLDPDNLCEKYILDCLRYCGVIQGDEPEKITLETTQRKAKKGEEEHTQIEIYEE